MKENDGCVLQKKMEDGGWMPVPIRNRKLSMVDRVALNRGEEIERDGEVLRRYDWAERKALAAALDC